MAIHHTPDRRYRIAVEEQGQGDGNTVVYDDVRGVVAWDRFSYEAGLPPETPPVLPPEPPPDPFTPPPLPGAPRLIQVTGEQDGRIPPRMMSYWANAWVNTDNSILVFCGSESGRPQFFRVDMGSRDVERLGDLGVPYRGETEGWYWTRDGGICLCDGPRFRRIYPLLNREENIFDISGMPGAVLWQPHSSDDGTVHSATVQQRVENGPWPKIGTVVYRMGSVEYFPAQGVLDESALTADGTYVIIKEDDDNRIINLSTRDTRYIRDRERAMGHSDCGPRYVVGEADKPDPGMCGWWDLNGPLNPERFHPLFPTLNMGYVAVRGDRILHSSATQLRLVDRYSEAITTLMDHGGGKEYDDRVKANLSPCGRVACFMSSFGSPRRDVYLLIL